jgi:hypothetical protein
MTPEAITSVERTMRMCMDSTAEHRARAMEITASAIPYLDEDNGFGIIDFFITSAFVVGFISKGEIPSTTQINEIATFMNAVKAGEETSN